MSRIVLLANDLPGLEVCKYIVENNDEIVRLYVPELSSKYAKEIMLQSRLTPERIFEADRLLDTEHVDELKNLAFDYIITVYWPYLLKPNFYESAREGTVNFHPAMLPINRGWYPHVHSLIDGTPTGVTLHAIDEGADTGPIWAQKEVPIQPYDTAKTIYDRLQQEIVQLFIQTWPKIKSKEIQPYGQDHSKAIYRKKKEVELLDSIDLDKEYKARDLINLLRARSFGNKGFSYYFDQGRKVFLNLRLNDDNSFDN